MTNCVKQGTAGVTRFILITMVSRFWSIRDKTGSLPAHPTGAPPTGGLGPGPDMEAARDLTALACGGAESPAPPGLERTRL